MNNNIYAKVTAKSNLRHKNNSKSIMIIASVV